MCPQCSSPCIRFGKSATGNQRYRCKKCKKTHSQSYRYHAYESGTDVSIKEHVKEGCGIRSIARLLKIATSTVLRRIVRISKAIMKPMITIGKDYELDEMCTYVKKKTNLRWIVYAIRKDNKEVVDFAVGSRNTQTLKLVTDTLILSNARMVYTDKLRQYATLFPMAIHKTTQYGTNHIERKNLSLRTHLKHLGRRTICFSRSFRLLQACLAIYFWG